MALFWGGRQSYRCERSRTDCMRVLCAAPLLNESRGCRNGGSSNSSCQLKPPPRSDCGGIDVCICRMDGVSLTAWAKLACELMQKTLIKHTDQTNSTVCYESNSRALSPLIKQTQHNTVKERLIMWRNIM